MEELIRGIYQSIDDIMNLTREVISRVGELENRITAVEQRNIKETLGMLEKEIT